jgi:hypothetical protein
VDVGRRGLRLSFGEAQQLVGRPLCAWTHLQPIHSRFLFSTSDWKSSKTKSASSKGNCQPLPKGWTLVFFRDNFRAVAVHQIFRRKKILRQNGLASFSMPLDGSSACVDRSIAFTGPPNPSF